MLSEILRKIPVRMTFETGACFDETGACFVAKQVPVSSEIRAETDTCLVTNTHLFWRKIKNL